MAQESGSSAKPDEWTCARSPRLGKLAKSSSILVGIINHHSTNATKCFESSGLQLLSGFYLKFGLSNYNRHHHSESS